MLGLYLPHPRSGKRQKILPLQQPLGLGIPLLRHAAIYLAAIVTANRFLPLARLLLMTSLPFLLDILTRKPWVLLREVLLG
jgi:hypothetical protein